MLNPRQKRFCELYHRYGNATRAYGEAYGCEPETARVDASKLLTKSNVKEEVERLQLEARKLFDVARVDMLKLFHEIATDKEEETRDRISAAKELCRMQGYYEAQKVELSADSEVVEMLRGLTGAKAKE